MALETILKTTGHGCILFLTETTFANSFKYSNRKKQTLIFFFLVHLPVYQGDRLNLYKFLAVREKQQYLKKEQLRELDSHLTEISFLQIYSAYCSEWSTLQKSVLVFCRWTISKQAIVAPESFFF